MQVRKHTEQMVDIVHRHRGAPSTALAELEKYEADHRDELVALNDRIRDLRPQLSSSEKRALAERWLKAVTDLRQRLGSMKPSEKN